MPNFIKARCVQCKEIVAEVATENVKKTPIILCLDCWMTCHFETALKSSDFGTKEDFISKWCK